MITQRRKSLCSIGRCVVHEAVPVEQVRQRILTLYPQPALFETGSGFQVIDGKQTMFMVDLLFELKLVDGTWYVYGRDTFTLKTRACKAAVCDANQSLWNRLRRVMQILALPDEFPLVLALGYSVARFIEQLSTMAIKKDEPEVLLRVYRYVVRYNDGERNAYIDVLKDVSSKGTDVATLLAALTDAEESASEINSWDIGAIQDLTNKNAFFTAVEKAKQHIQGGDIYQIQLSRCALSRAMIPPLKLYERLVSINPAPYMYYLDLGEQYVISASPELMIRSDKDVAQVRPIAGTKTQDDQRDSGLNHIPKEAAEHLMLVDLARNDLARCAIKGGVKVTSLMQVDTYGPLQHLVSTIETPLSANCDIWDLIAANFPAGTMTGAPKVRAMELINDLEKRARGLFTGCAGYITGFNSGVFALNIRTIIGNPGNYLLQAAAGIVADSTASAEWNEAGAKIKSFARVIGG